MAAKSATKSFIIWMCYYYLVENRKKACARTTSEFHAFEANALCGIGLGRRLGTVWLARRDWGALAGGKCEVSLELVYRHARQQDGARRRARKPQGVGT